MDVLDQIIERCSKPAPTPKEEKLAWVFEKSGRILKMYLGFLDHHLNEMLPRYEAKCTPAATAWTGVNTALYIDIRLNSKRSARRVAFTRSLPLDIKKKNDEQWLFKLAKRAEIEAMTVKEQLRLRHPDRSSFDTNFSQKHWWKGWSQRTKRRIQEEVAEFRNHNAMLLKPPVSTVS